MSMGFSRQEYLSGLPFPSPGDLPNPRIKPTSLKSPALTGVFFTTSTPWESPHIEYYTVLYKYLYMWSPIQMLQSMKNSRYISAVKLHNEWRKVKAGTLQKDEGKQVNDAADDRELKTTSLKKLEDLTFLTQEWNRAGKNVAQKVTHWQLGWCRGPLDQPQISR